MEHEEHHQGEQKYFVNIEGTDYPWHEEDILTEEIRKLGNLPQDLPVVEEFPDGTEITLRAGEVVHLKPGHRFGRAPKFKRG
ncbi:MAG: hypothetical protein PHP73_00995 [Candidatus Omnitrophica bacterium]|nr:hypothetical protein [Candidatus Omnitrophota bacterium]